MRILLNISYNGSKFCGFQKQNNGVSIQSELENALQKVCNEQISVTPSGRTDAKVHAINQCVHFDTQSKIAMQKMPQAVNTFLPPDIRVNEAKQVDGDFHARKSVKKKTYMYVFSKSKIISPFEYDFVSPLEYDVDVNLIETMSKNLLGTHNFKAFCSSGTSATSFERTIYDVTVEEKENKLIFKITGNGFLYNMVRIIVGTLVDVGRGKLPTNTIQKMLETGDRNLGGKTAKPNGLYLYNIEY